MESKGSTRSTGETSRSGDATTLRCQIKQEILGIIDEFRQKMISNDRTQARLIDGVLKCCVSNISTVDHVEVLSIIFDSSIVTFTATKESG